MLENMVVMKLQMKSLRTSCRGQEIRHRAAIEIQKRAENLQNLVRQSSQIDRAIAQSNHVKLRPLMLEIAEILSPNTLI